MRLTDTFIVGNTVIEIALADITTIDVDVIVNSICERLHFGTGVAGSIIYNGGNKIKDEVLNHLGLVDPGSIIVTGAGELSYKSIYHAISSRCAAGTTKEILINCVLNSLNQARNDDVESIAFPALGTGEMDFDVHEAAKILINTVIQDCIDENKIKRVVFCLLRPDGFTAFFREAVRQCIIRETQCFNDSHKDVSSETHNLIKSLELCSPGQASWKEYEDISVKIFEHLFSPPLSPPRIQEGTENGLRIRDAIFPNYAEEGYWKILDGRYRAQMIILECKNYTNPIDQNAVNQICRYFQNKALGNVGFIASRVDPSKSALKARTEAFRDTGCIIIFISDFDFAQMVELKRVGKAPEIYIKRKVEDFILAY